jgi:hypothetical protein
LQTSALPLGYATTSKAPALATSQAKLESLTLGLSPLPHKLLAVIYAVIILGDYTAKVGWLPN